jgi:UDP-2,4-diacetamido-2,4,6-trideoxy-beta-L-altropyranose hydrolase
VNSKSISGRRSAFQIANRFKVILDQAHRDFSEVGKLCSTSTFMELLPWSKNLSKDFLESDICIGASGTTLYERFILGLPSIVVTVAENQIPLAEEAHKQGLIKYLGHSGDTSLNYKKMLEELLPQSEIWKQMSQDCFNYLNLKSENFLKEVAKKHAPVIQLRKATVSDKSRLFEWRNNPLIYQYFSNPHPVKQEEHNAWFEGVMSDEKKVVVIGETESKTRSEFLDLISEIVKRR